MTDDKVKTSKTSNTLPSGWIETTLGEVCVFNYGKGLKTEERIFGSIPVYGSGGITGLHNKALINEKGLIIGRKGSVGTIFKSKNAFYPIDTVFYITQKDTVCDLEFLYRLLQSLGLDKKNSDSAVPGLNRENAYSTQIILPPLPEQKAIAAVLSSFDAKIELLREENKTLEEIGKTIFNEWFGKYSVDDELPEGWRVGKLGEEFDITIGRTPPRVESQWFSDIPTGKKWISIKDIGNSGTYIFDTSEFLTDQAIEKFNIPVIPENTTILSFKMTVGKLTITTEEMLSNEAIAHLKLKQNSVLSSEFIYSYLQNLDFNALGSTSSIVTAINSTMIKNLEFLIPDQKTLTEFYRVIQPIFVKIKNNSKQIQSLSCCCYELLPMLMSGQIRVNY